MKTYLVCINRPALGMNQVTLTSIFMSVAKPFKTITVSGVSAPLKLYVLQSTDLSYFIKTTKKIVFSSIVEEMIRRTVLLNPKFNV